MFMKKILKIAVGLMLVISFAGCGSEGNSNTNGTLSLVVTASDTGNIGVANMTATALLTPVQTGSVIHFSSVMYNGGGVIANTSFSSNISTDVTGTAIWNANFQRQATDSTLEVTASSGGLIAVQRIAIPKFP